MTSYDAVLLDMDGVLVDSEAYWQSQMEEILDDVTKDDVQFTQFVGRNPREQYELLRSEYDVDISRTEYLIQYSSNAESIYREKVDLISDFREIVNTIEVADIPIGLVSSSPPEWIAMVLDEFKLTEVFDVLVSGSALNAPSKPSPDIYQRAAAELNLETSNIIAVEDTLTGVNAALAADMYCIAYRVNQEGSTGFNKANEVIESGESLASRLESLLINR